MQCRGKISEISIQKKKIKNHHQKRQSQIASLTLMSPAADQKDRGLRKPHVNVAMIMAGLRREDHSIAKEFNGKTRGSRFT